MSERFRTAPRVVSVAMKAGRSIFSVCAAACSGAGLGAAALASGDAGLGVVATGAGAGALSSTTAGVWETGRFWGPVKSIQPVRTANERANARKRLRSKLPTQTSGS